MTADRFRNDFLPLSDGLFRLAYSILHSKEEAEDAVQELYLKLWQSDGDLPDVRNPRAYCLTLMRNFCIDRIRSRQFKDKCSIDSMQQSVEGLQIEQPPDDRRLGDRQRLKEITAGIEHLPPRERMVLKMKVMEDLSYEQMQKRTGLPNLTLRVLLSNARKKLRKQYGND